MKKLILACSILLSISAFAETHQVGGEKAANLFNALADSGVTLVENNTYFRLAQPLSVVCVTQTADDISEFKSPVCTANGKSLKKTDALNYALGQAGADQEAGMGKFYTSADDISCQFFKAQKSFKCQMSTIY